MTPKSNIDFTCVLALNRAALHYHICGIHARLTVAKELYEAIICGLKILVTAFTQSLKEFAELSNIFPHMWLGTVSNGCDIFLTYTTGIFHNHDEY